MDNVRDFSNIKNMRHNVSFASISWFRCGGLAENLFKPRNQNELASFLSTYKNVKIHVIGACSNILVRDGGIDGVVIKLGKEFSYCRLLDNYQIEVGCATLDRAIAEFCLEESIGGIEFLYTIPGTLGGNIRMNAGCHGTEIRDVLVSCKVMDRNGNIHELDAEDIPLQYRSNALPTDLIFISAILQGYKMPQDAIASLMKHMQEQRLLSQPINVRTSGSTFKNIGNIKAWELIDKCNLRGMIIGGAQISEKHCNFLLNINNATSADLENLGELIREHVMAKHNITLEWEIDRIGRYLKLDRI